MMTSERLAQLSPAEREAWMASLTDDENVILRASRGQRYTLVAIAEVKRYLSQEIPAHYRLKFLEFLERCADTFTPDAIMAVQPMPDEGMEICKEAQKLGCKWLDVVARWEVFSALVVLNPSMLAVLKMPNPWPRAREIGGNDVAAMPFLRSPQWSEHA